MANSARGQEMGADRGFVNLRRHPHDMEDGHDVRFQNAERAEAEPPEDKGRRFVNEDVAVGHETVPPSASPGHPLGRALEPGACLSSH